MIVGDDQDMRDCLVVDTTQSIQHALISPKAFATLLNVDVENAAGGIVHFFVQATINSFFDNDLWQTKKYFLDNAKGSFGLLVSCSLDAHPSICLAARGQTMSIAFYPKKGSGKSILTGVFKMINGQPINFFSQR